MCSLIEEIDGDADGYKVVAIKKSDSKYYSAAMGFRYRQNRLIPKIKRQRCISDHFYKGILSDLTYCFEPEMTSRTAVFKNKEDAVILCNKLCHKKLYNCRQGDYSFAVVEATVYIDVMNGYYAYCDVFAGRKIKFGKVVYLP